MTKTRCGRSWPAPLPWTVTIVTAQDGAEALDILIREEGAFDLLLTDIQMPVMDGIALALTAARDFPDNQK